MSVLEIIRPPKMAKVPRTPAYVDGIANLRGIVLPVIDLRTRFGMERCDETDRTRVLVVEIDGVKTGLRVDRVKQVTRVLRSEIGAPPAAIRGASSDYLEGVVKLHNGERVVMALNAAHVCEIGVSRNPTPVVEYLRDRKPQMGTLRTNRQAPKSGRWSRSVSGKRNSPFQCGDSSEARRLSE